jgi:thioredoxin-like negative regulator of GroEL
LAQGKACLNADDLACAEQNFQGALRADSSSVAAYVNLGMIFYRDRRYGDAVALLSRCPDQSDVDLREQLGLSLYKTGAQDRAIQLLEAVVKERPDAFASQLQLGVALLKSDPKRAAGLMEAYLRQRPATLSFSDREVRERLGAAYLLARDWPHAIATYEQLLVARKDLAVMLGLATALVGTRDCSRAIDLLERVLGDAPKQPSIYYNLAKCYLEVRRAADAEREAGYYRKAKPIEREGCAAARGRVPGAGSLPRGAALLSGGTPPG